MSTTLLCVFIVAISLFAVFAVYALIPELFVHFFGIGSWKRHYSPGVTLTFDDGPDPRYTPKFLAVLAEQNVRACFFLVAEKAEKQPELVKSILDHGHTVGSHGYRHRHAWLMPPLKTWNLWNKAMEEMHRLTGQEPVYVRAPWGGVNLSLLFWCHFKGKKLISWSADGRDWHIERTPHRIVQRITHRTKEGTIILLHDSGGDKGAPENTLAALKPLVIEIQKELKLPLVPLQLPDWSLPRRIGFRVWEKWELFYARCKQITRIDERNIFRLGLTRYHGPDLFNENGELIASAGDMVGEIHLDNTRFRGLGTNIQKIGYNALKQARLSLPVLARYISLNPNYKDIKAFLGITLINRGVKGLGFNVTEYTNGNAGFIGFMQKIVYRVYNPSAKKDTEKLGTKPKVVWISKDALLEKYLTKKSSTQG
ncbi:MULTISPECIES: polysaccharide deacetylase family protein [unclassified Dehalobacter]|uniref:polysaccharide deacetylase family protein n=1 Tax=unclassified Dehalobacter TaxID=2635733 RepID=UPI000E6CC383|nr:MULTISPECIES: polysaccharide deacetylase family protein [unclassified Dehalobacter]RJE48446.1 polysaccharide deacetylase [Dehalobacter sp. MCB1]TCX50514.1 polysaccharide deacetylase family protein [Dehalobacter sp. 14DCB1]TCX52246.1 polysaccharide deacetylase family protein [Dehalobacter sp. 12DCB1]